MEKLRLLPKLRILNLEENPITKKFSSFRIFIAGLLENLKFYNNYYLHVEEKKQGKNLYK